MESVEMAMLGNDNKLAAVQDSERNAEIQMDIGEELSMDRNFKEKFLVGCRMQLINEEHVANNCDNNEVVEDALEKTINEVAEVCDLNMPLLLKVIFQYN